MPNIYEHAHHIVIQQAIEWLTEQCGIDASAAQQLLEYIREGRRVLGAVPSQKTVIAERF